MGEAGKAGGALIVGVGTGLSAALARRLSRAGYRVTLAARDMDKLAALASETGARRQACDASDPAAVAGLFAGLEGRLDVAIYNRSMRARGPVGELDPEAVRRALEVTAFGAFLMGREAARRMLEQEPVAGCRGTILFTGASAGEKGFALSAAFAMGKFAQRGLAQAMARELQPKGIHIAWINIDGGIASATRTAPPERPDSLLDPDAIAEAYLGLVRQPRSAWTSELALRPWLETF